MGIDVHSFQLLGHATRKFGALGKTITLGRLGVFLGPRSSRKWLGTSGGAYCEALLKEHFGASTVDSIDNSRYEGATIVADMNHPVPEALEGQYDTVIDFGCTEHIFDVAQSLRNVASMCKIGGTILHAVPANGFCGHGFYQFSPELFFSLYSQANGFAHTEVFIADLCDIHSWYRVPQPQDGKRVNVRSNGEIYVLAITRRISKNPERVQQSDYEFTWDKANEAAIPPRAPGRMAAIRELLYRSPLIARLVYAVDSSLAPTGARQPRHHRHLQRIKLPNI